MDSSSNDKVIRRTVWAVATSPALNESEADERLAALGEEAVPALIEMIAIGGRAPITMAGWFVTLLILGAGSCALAAYLNVYHHIKLPSIIFPILVPATTYMLTRAYVANGSQKNAANALRILQSKRSIGPLSRSLNSQHPHVRRVSREIIVALLPEMTEADAAGIETADLKRLLAQLQGDDPALARAVLAATPKLNAAIALPYVERLTSKDPNPAAPDAELIDEARRLLPALRARAQEELEASKLLRPAAIQGDCLLRPAQRESPNESHLLRAGEVSEP